MLRIGILWDLHALTKYNNILSWRRENLFPWVFNRYCCVQGPFDWDNSDTASILILIAIFLVAISRMCSYALRDYLHRRSILFKVYMCMHIYCNTFYVALIMNFRLSWRLKMHSNSLKNSTRTIIVSKYPTIIKLRSICRAEFHWRRSYYKPEHMKALCS